MHALAVHATPDHRPRLGASRRGWFHPRPSPRRHGLSLPLPLPLPPLPPPLSSPLRPATSLRAPASLHAPASLLPAVSLSSLPPPASPLPLSPPLTTHPRIDAPQLIVAPRPRRERRRLRLGRGRGRPARPRQRRAPLDAAPHRGARWEARDRNLTRISAHLGACCSSGARRETCARGRGEVRAAPCSPSPGLSLTQPSHTPRVHIARHDSRERTRRERRSDRQRSWLTAWVVVSQVRVVVRPHHRRRRPLVGQRPGSAGAAHRSTHQDVIFTGCVRLCIRRARPARPRRESSAAFGAAAARHRRFPRPLSPLTPPIPPRPTCPTPATTLPHPTTIHHHHHHPPPYPTPPTPTTTTSHDRPSRPHRTAGTPIASVTAGNKPLCPQPQREPSLNLR